MAQYVFMDRREDTNEISVCHAVEQVRRVFDDNSRIIFVSSP